MIKWVASLLMALAPCKPAPHPASPTIVSYTPYIPINDEYRVIIIPDYRIRNTSTGEFEFRSEHPDDAGAYRWQLLSQLSIQASTATYAPIGVVVGHRHITVVLSAGQSQ